jgi:hypothetical protein
MKKKKKKQLDYIILYATCMRIGERNYKIVREKGRKKAYAEKQTLTGTKIEL